MSSIIECIFAEWECNNIDDSRKVVPSYGCGGCWKSAHSQNIAKNNEEGQ